jgi:ATP-dependent Clp protease adaptor protein ClpS
MTKYQEEIEVDLLNIEKTIDTRLLVIHNDEVNTFDWVIDCLIDICKHDFEQAEQCAMIIHTKGKYAVKEGSLNSLKPFKDAMSERGLSVTIE